MLLETPEDVGFITVMKVILGSLPIVVLGPNYTGSRVGQGLIPRLLIL